jgi:hypothetical protein
MFGPKIGLYGWCSMILSQCDSHPEQNDSWPITNMSSNNNRIGMNLQFAHKTSSETYLFLHRLVLDEIASKATAIAKTTSYQHVDFTA